MFKFFRAVSGDYARSILVSLFSVLIVVALLVGVPTCALALAAAVFFVVAIQ